MMLETDKLVVDGVETDKLKAGYQEQAETCLHLPPPGPSTRHSHRCQENRRSPASLLRPEARGRVWPAAVASDVVIARRRHPTPLVGAAPIHRRGDLKVLDRAFFLFYLKRENLEKFFSRPPVLRCMMAGTTFHYIHRKPLGGAVR